MTENGGSGRSSAGGACATADNSDNRHGNVQRGVGSLSDTLARNQLGFGHVKNKHWTRRVDGLVRRDEHETGPQFSNWLKFSLKKSCSVDECVSELTEEEFDDMGNLQGGESRKAKDGTKSPMKEKKRGLFLSKKPAVPKVIPSVTVAPTANNDAQLAGGVALDEPQAHQHNGTRPVEEECPSAMDGDTRLFSTESWRAVNKAGSRDSSSESIFMDPLTSPRVPDVPGSVSQSCPPTDSSSTTQQHGDSSSLDDVTLIDDDLDESASSFLRDTLHAVGLSEPFSEPLTEPAIPTQRPTSFTLNKHRKVELGSVSGSIALPNSSTDASRRHSSVSDVPSDNVLRKVASLVLDGNSSDQRLSKPKAVPEKLDYHIYDKFEGQQLLNWYVGSFPDDHYLRMLLTTQDLRILGAQFCTHMLAAGVLKQIPDKDAPFESVFRPDLMYVWSHSEMTATTPITPGRLPSNLWSQTVSPIGEGLPPRTGPRYSEADCGTPGFTEMNPMTASTTSVDKAIRKIEAEEYQTMMMGLKREHQDSLVKLTRGQEVRMFNLRGEHAQKIQEQAHEIVQLKFELETLKQEIERLKTISEIQDLTKNALKDFESPTSPKKQIKTQEIGTDAREPSPTIPTPLKELSEPLVFIEVQSSQSGSMPENVISKQSLSDDSSLVKETTTSTTPPNLTPKENEPDKTASAPGFQTEPKVDIPPMVSAPMPPPPPPPMLGAGPPPAPLPPPLLSVGPPPPPMPGTGPPAPPPFAGMGPPPPPMPGMGPPPPPMPGMGPPPPPMPGMGPPPPPMPGMGPPPPPPMAGMPGPPLGAPPPPPAPGSAPTPFPAPPVGGWNAQRAVLRKPPLTPAVPMKPLFWSRIIVPVADSLPPPTSPSEPVVVPLWQQLEEASIDDLSELNALFSRQITTRKPTKKKTQAPAKAAAAKILDSKRSQNVGILASSLHVDFSEIENAVYNFDTSVVSLEALHQIYEARANPEELRMMKEHVSSTPDVPLDKPEQFLLELSDIPNFAERIACFMFQTEYEDVITGIDSKLNNIKSVCDMLCGDSVKSIMATVLAIGNYMNGGNMSRGQADGFAIDILPKLRDVKSTDSSVTLLHFLVRTILKRQDTDSPLPLPEPGDISRAALVDASEVANDLNRLEEDLKVCERKIQTVIAASNEDNLQPFKQKMETFLESAKLRLKGERDNLEECQMKFKTTAKFYQFRPKSSDEAVSEFFGIWAPFAKDFKDIWKKEQQRLIKEKMQEIKKKQEESKKEVKAVKAGGLKERMKQRLQNKTSS